MTIHEPMTLGGVVLAAIAAVYFSGPALRAVVDWLEPKIDAHDGGGLRLRAPKTVRGMETFDEALRDRSTERRKRAEQLRNGAAEIRRRACRVESGGAEFPGNAADRIRKIR